MADSSGSTQRAIRLWAAAAALAAAMAIGWAQNRLALVPIPPGAGRLRRLGYAALGDALIQLGLLGLLVVGWVAWRTGWARSWRRSVRPRGFLALSLLLAMVLVFATGEVTLRLVYRSGASFSHHDGPLVRRFERDFVFNRYDVSRGPEIDADGAAGRPRLLIQGDSITWGQGVRREDELFTTLLLTRLRDSSGEAEMAVLARPGRDIDGHVQQLRKWGPGIDPDAIVYQWFVNDLELTQQGRPSRKPPWRRLFFHQGARQYSYFYFLLDYRLGGLWRSGQTSYDDYILDTFEGDTPQWREFEHWFADWATEATRLTPRVLLVLYPRSPARFRDTPIHRKLQTLAARQGILVLDLVETLPELAERGRGLDASRFDSHPGPEAHRLLAGHLAETLTTLWGDLLDPLADGSASSSGRVD